MIPTLGSVLKTEVSLHWSGRKQKNLTCSNSSDLPFNNVVSNLSPISLIFNSHLQHLSMTLRNHCPYLLEFLTDVTLLFERIVYPICLWKSINWSITHCQRKVIVQKKLPNFFYLSLKYWLIAGNRVYPVMWDFNAACSPGLANTAIIGTGKYGLGETS